MKCYPFDASSSVCAMWSVCRLCLRPSFHRSVSGAISTVETGGGPTGQEVADDGISLLQGGVQSACAGGQHGRRGRQSFGPCGSAQVTPAPSRCDPSRHCVPTAGLSDRMQNTGSPAFGTTQEQEQEKVLWTRECRRSWRHVKSQSHFQIPQESMSSVHCFLSCRYF
jgi:hypothetical protein